MKNCCNNEVFTGLYINVSLLVCELLTFVKLTFWSGAILSGADLSGVILSDANLSDATLSSADLSSADLRNANLNFVRLSEKVKGARFSNNKEILESMKRDLIKNGSIFEDSSGDHESAYSPIDR